MSRLASRRTRSLALVAWALALLFPQAARGPVALHLRSVPAPGHVRLRTTRSRSGSGASMRSGVDVESPVLGHARGTTFAAGTNLRRGSGGEAWPYLLPSLELGLVLCVGAPSAASVRTLARLGDEVVVCGEGRRERWTMRRRCGREGALVLAPAALPARRADLAIAGGSLTAVSDPRLSAALRRARSLFVDPLGEEPAAPPLGRSACELRLTPAGDEALVSAAADTAAGAYLARSGAAESLAGKSRRAFLTSDGAAPGRLRTPAYVQEIAAAFGLDLEGHRVAVAAPSRYASRKAVMFLFAGEEPEPDLVVKLAREARQNHRLENEWRALNWLAEADVRGDPPRPRFLGHHAGIAVLGQSAVRGAPFRSRTSARPGCPLARAALEWLLELGVATAHPAASNGAVAAALDDLASRFDALYRLTGRQRAALRRHIDALASASSPLPLVLQHGDPGAWNLLVAAGGTPAFLDWEAAERHGMPLWDVFYFVRSFAVTVARARGRSSSLAAVRRELLADAPLNRLLASAVGRHCDEIGLDRALVEPLFVTCWMHRALKEATRLPRRRVDSGHYVNLLRLCLSRPDAPGLRRLYGLS